MQNNKTAPSLSLMFLLPKYLSVLLQFLFFYIAGAHPRQSATLYHNQMLKSSDVEELRTFLDELEKNEEGKG